jgi:peptide/nickel transport system substrate-binding protein
LRIAVDAELRELDPLRSGAVWPRRIMMGTVLETLVRHQVGAAGEVPQYRPGLARAWRVLAGGLELRLELQPDVLFHDGRALTAVDVQATLDWVRDPRNRVDHLRPLLADVEAVELVSPREVRIRLYRANAWLLRALAEIPILPGSRFTPGAGDGAALIGTGPWRLASAKANLVRLEAWPQYRGGSPAIAHLEFVRFLDAAQALMAAKRGEIDVIPELIPAHWPEQATAPGIASAFEVVSLPPARVRYLIFNAGAAPTDDARVRAALGYLVDRRAIAKGVHDGLALPLRSLVWPGGPIHGSATEVPLFNPETADRLLSEAGWADHDKDGARDRGGQSLRLRVLATEADGGPPVPGAPPSERSIILSAWRRAGIAVDLRDGSEAVLGNRLRDGEFEVAFVERATLADSDLSPWLHSGRSDNLGRFSSRRIDQLLVELAQAWEPQARSAVALRLVESMGEETPISTLVAMAPQALVHRRIVGETAWAGWLDFSAARLAPATER